jgi:hypothetical protein
MTLTVSVWICHGFAVAIKSQEVIKMAWLKLLKFTKKINFQVLLLPMSFVRPRKIATFNIASELGAIREEKSQISGQNAMLDKAQDFFVLFGFKRPEKLNESRDLSHSF